MLSTKRVNKPIEDIVIVESFGNAKPNADKVRERYAKWLNTGVVPGEIMIDKYNRLFDGYTAYLVHRMIGSKTVECLRITGKMEDEKTKELENENQYLKAKCDKLQKENAAIKEKFDRLSQVARCFLLGER